MRKLKRKINLFFRKHYKIYTLLILALGIALGCTYEGRGEDNTHYFNIMGHTLYLGLIL